MNMFKDMSQMRVGLTMIVISGKVLMAGTGHLVLLVPFKIQFQKTSFSGENLDNSYTKLSSPNPKSLT